MSIGLEELLQYLPFLIPIALVQVGLMIASLIHILRHKTYRVGSRVIWIVICLLINIVGPVLYFAVGRGEE